MRITYINLLGSSVSVIMAVAFVLHAKVASAGVLSITIAGQSQELVGWSAAQTSVVSAFSGQVIPAGTTVYAYNEDLQQYDIITYDFGVWSIPTYNLRTARGFFIKNPTTSTHTYTLNYTLLPAGNYSVTIVAGKWQLLAFAYNKHGWLELPPSPYTAFPNLNWPGLNIGDVTYQWNSSGQVWNPILTRTADFTRQWNTGDHHSPWIANWTAFFINNSATRTWTMHSTDGE